MRTLLLIIAMLATNAQAETIATGGFFDPVVRIITSCENCKKMEKIRTEVFVPVHRNARLKAKAREALGAVHEFGDHLKSLDQKELRGAHYVNEIESYMILASDALPYDEGLQVAEDIAYLNIELGATTIFNRALNKIEIGCRRDFLYAAVNAKQCTIQNEREQEKASQEKRKPALKKCEPLNVNIEACELKKRQRVK